MLNTTSSFILHSTVLTLDSGDQSIIERAIMEDEERSKENYQVLNFSIYSSASEFYKFWLEKNVTKNCDKSNAKGFRYVAK